MRKSKHRTYAFFIFSQERSLFFMSLPSPARGKGLAVSILSLSLLTVMAGAAVAPALGVTTAPMTG